MNESTMSKPQTIPFVLPTPEVLKKAKAKYAIRNYGSNGLSQKFKRRRFLTALELAGQPRGHGVIDMGCCDGILLPSLAPHFKKVVGIDYHPTFAERSRLLAEASGLCNVSIVCNQEKKTAEIRDEIGGGFQLMFLLETLEHVGQQPNMWGTKKTFLDECFELLDPSVDSRIIASVPKMVGLGFMVKHVIQMARGVRDDHMPILDVVRSGFLKNTDNLEERWNGGHVGFNHLKLEALLSQHFKIANKVENPFSSFYEIRRGN